MPLAIRSLLVSALLLGSASCSSEIGGSDDDALPNDRGVSGEVTSVVKPQVLYADLDGLSDRERLMFVSLQGIANRNPAGPLIYLKGQPHDGEWIDWYEEAYGYDVVRLSSPYELFDRQWPVAGYVKVDPIEPESDNIAANYASIESLLPVTEFILNNRPVPDWEVKRDLTGRFRNMSKVDIYRWVETEQWPEASRSVMANLSAPVDGIYRVYKSHNIRDYVIAHGGIFVDLSSKPGTEERALKSEFYAELEPRARVFGWHTPRDNEFQYVTHASEYGALVLCSTTASNFSLHERIDIGGATFEQPQRAERGAVSLQQDKIYLTYVYSDGDSLNHVSKGHGAQWFRDDRGSFPIGWEVQYLLADIAPGMLHYFYATATANDTFVGSASGIGYTFPDRMTPADLGTMLEATKPYLALTDTTTLVVLNHNIDPPWPVQKQYGEHLGPDLVGVLSGYWRTQGSPVLYHGTNWRTVDSPKFGAIPAKGTFAEKVDATYQDILSRVDLAGPTPQFVAFHLAKGALDYGVLKAVHERLLAEHPGVFRVVGPDEFFIAARKAQLADL